MAFSFLDWGNGVIVPVVKIIFALAATLVIARAMGIFLKHSFKRISWNLRIDETQFMVLRRLIVFVIYLLGLAVAGSMVPGFKTFGMSLLASAGVIAIIVGFAAQQTFSNVISGVFIALFEPFKVGDWVTIKEEYGVVEDITLRHTVIKTWQEKRLIIPNSKMGEEYIINYSIKNPRILGILDIGISYDSDIDKARAIMLEEAEKNPNVLKEVRGPTNEFLKGENILKVRLIALTDSAQTMRLYFWAPDQTTAMKTKYDLTEAIKKRFDKEGIEIPFPYRTIVYKKDIDKK
ncbi:MAG: mechanosensitive ion channel family protein [Candidatus Altiarchaeota archaeon]